MSDPYLSEIRIYPYSFPPQGWAWCDGQEIEIKQNQLLYSLIGNIYGGELPKKFALPDLRGRTPIHPTNTYPIGKKDGKETVNLTIDELPTHRHFCIANKNVAQNVSPENNVPAKAGETRLPNVNPLYTSAASMQMLNPLSITYAGSSEGHPNIQPSLGLNYCICINGVYPERS